MKALIVDKDDLIYNIKKIKKKENNSYKFIGVIKGNGYGLGLIDYAKFLIENGIDCLAVATIEEAILLRKSGIKEDILMISATSLKEDLETLINNDIIITIGSKKCAEILKEIGKKHIRAHIKIDTGFGRYGFLYNEINDIIYSIKILNNVSIEGIYSHFSCAYYKNSKCTKKQFDRFMEVLKGLESNGINIKYRHICNSHAFINYPEMRLNCARIGSAFLGRVCFKKNEFKKIGKLKTNITEIKIVPKGFNIGYLNCYKTKKETKIAIIQVGYMDGFNITLKNDMHRLIDKIRGLSNDLKKILKKEIISVIINNKKYRVIGKVGMYHIAIDITSSDIKLGDIVYLDINPLFIDKNIRREYI